MGPGEGDFPVRQAELGSELREVRLAGLHRVRETPVEKLLRECSRVGILTDSPMHAIEELLGRAIEGFDDDAAARSARCTFGLGSGMRMRPAQDRRRAAAGAQGLSVERFRRRREGEIVDQIAAEILALSGPADAAPGPAPARNTWVRVTTFADEVEYSLHNLLEGAVRIAVYGKSWVNLFNQHTRRLVEVVAAGGEVRVVLLRAEPGAGEHIYPSDVWSSEHILNRNLTAAHERLREIRHRAGDGSGGIEVRETDVVPQYGFIATSTSPEAYERGIAQLNFAHTRVEADRLVLCLTEGSPALAAFVEEFEAAWARATPWADAA